jgi:hypothetical protein
MSTATKNKGRKALSETHTLLLQQNTQDWVVYKEMIFIWRNKTIFLPSFWFLVMALWYLMSWQKKEKQA